MLLQGKGMHSGITEGDVVLSKEKISFLDGIDPKSGKIVQKCDAEGKSIDEKVFVFKGGKGSTVGIYTIYGLKYYKKSPLAFITEETDEIVACGAAIISIPYVSAVPLSVFKDGDKVFVDGKKGIVEIKGVELHEIATSFIKKNDKVAIFKRSEKVSTYKLRWAGISGKIETGEHPLQTALREIEEELGINKEDLKLLNRTNPIYIRDENIVWKVYPFLWELVVDKSFDLQWEHVEFRWVDVEDIKRYDTVPQLYETLLLLLRDKNSKIL